MILLFLILLWLMSIFILYTEMDFSIKDIIKIVKNGFIYSFLKSSDIEKYIKKVNTYIKTNKWDI